MASAPPISQATLVRDKFDARASDYSTWYEGETYSAAAFRRRRELTLEVLRNVSPGKVLDIGCGPGVLIEGLLAQGHEVWGVDLAPAMIQQCCATFGGEPRAHFGVGKIEALDFADGFFDAITCLGVVEYLDDDRAALRELRRVLRPGGLAVITCPHFWAPWRRWDALYWSVVEPLRRLLGRAPYSLVRHREYREGEYRQLLAEHGLIVEDVAYYGFGLVPTPLDRRLPRLHSALARILDDQARGPLKQLGMGFNVTVRKAGL
jgi:SAM-dependent methyltransferase